MTNKERLITELYLNTTMEVASSVDNWLSFLKSASYNYKYRFDEQILIYAQRPDATAVAETPIWNKKLKRWVNKGSKGIALITERNGEMGLRFVFDVSDTNSNVYGRKFKLWTLEEKYSNEIIEALENKFGTMENKDSVPFAIMSTAFNHLAENMQDYLEELKEVTKNSKLETLEEQKLEEVFLETLMYSTIALTMSRCGIDVEQYIQKPLFSNIEMFNTFETISILGTATRDFSKEILLEISKTIINVQKQEKNINRTFERNKKNDYDKNIEKEKGSVLYDRYNLRNERGLSNTKSSITRGQEQENEIRQVRSNEIELPKGEKERNLHNVAYEQQIERTLDTNRQNSEQQEGNNSRTNDEETRNNRRIESKRPDGMDRTDEQYTSDSRTDSSQRDNLRIGEQPTEKEAEIASFFDDLKIIEVLKNAPNVVKNREDIDKFINNLENDLDSNVEPFKEYISKVLGNAYTEFYYNDERVGYLVKQNELTIWKGDYLHRTDETNISWKKVTENFILEYEARLRNTEIKVEKPEYNKEDYYFHTGDSIYIGLDEYKILDINNGIYTIYNVNFPLLQEKINIEDIMDKIIENPMNDYLKEERTEEVTKEETDFNKWLDTFIEEKGIDLNETFEIEANGQLHIFEIGNIVENIKITTQEEQEQIKNMIVKIDFYNGDVIDYFKHLAQALIKTPEQEIEKEETTIEDKKQNEEIAKRIKNKSRNIEYFDLHPEIPSEERNNFRIKDDELGVGTLKEKYKNNIEAIKILRICEEQNRYATKEEQQVLSKYVGWGGLKPVFDKNNDSWAKEYEELKELLTEEEYKDARKSSLTAYYTPPLVIRNMYKALQNMGLERANILEPSCRSR